MKAPIIIINLMLLLLITVSCRANKGNILLVNSASQPISQALVTVCGQQILFNNIQPGDSSSASYKVLSDSHYNISVEFKSGKRLQKKEGYVTNGFDFRHKIVVTDIDIGFQGGVEEE